MDHLPFLFAAYSIVWIAIFLYVLSLDRRARAVERDLEELRERLQGSRPGGSAGGVTAPRETPRGSR